MIDLATLDASTASEATFDLELLHPKTDEPIGVVIQIIGYHSKAVQDVVNVHRNEGLKRSFEAQRKGSAKAPTASEVDRKSAAVLAAATVGWYTLEPSKKHGDEPKRVEGLTFGGKLVEFSADEAVTLYSNPGYGWIASQVDKAIVDMANFMKG